jgi:hypothetical protein
MWKFNFEKLDDYFKLVHPNSTKSNRVTIYKFRTVADLKWTVFGIIFNRTGSCPDLSRVCIMLLFRYTTDFFSRSSTTIDLKIDFG